MDKSQQEKVLKLQMLERQLRDLYEQVESVNRAATDLTTLGNGLTELKNSKGKDILALVGRGIFIRGKILSDDLIMDIGENNLVKRDISQTQDIINTQVKRLEEVKDELEDSIKALNEELTKEIMGENKKGN